MPHTAMQDNVAMLCYVRIYSSLQSGTILQEGGTLILSSYVSALQTIVVAHMHADTTGNTWSAAVVTDLAKLKVDCKKCDSLLCNLLLNFLFVFNGLLKRVAVSERSSSPGFTKETFFRTT